MGAVSFAKPIADVTGSDTAQNSSANKYGELQAGLPDRESTGVHSYQCKTVANKGARIIDQALAFNDGHHSFIKPQPFGNSGSSHCIGRGYDGAQYER